MSSFITNRDIPIFVTIPVIFLASKKNSVQNGKMGAKNSVAKELNAAYLFLCDIIQNVSMKKQ